MVTRTVLFDATGTLIALDYLRSGAVIAFPTDTVYGLGCNVWDGQAVASVYTVKERPMTMPLPVLLATPSDLEHVVTEVSPLASAIAERAWPGALTLVLPARPSLPPELLLGGSTIAVRVPDHDQLRQLIHAHGPIAGTSANRHKQPAPTNAASVHLQLKGRIPLILDGGPSGAELASTIIDLTTAQPRLIRAGAFDLATISDLVPTLAAEG